MVIYLVPLTKSAVSRNHILAYFVLICDCLKPRWGNPKPQKPRCKNGDIQSRNQVAQSCERAQFSRCDLISRRYKTD